MSPPFRFPIHRPMIRACAMLAATAAATVGAAEERTTTATDRGVEVAADVWCPLPVAVLRLDAVQTPADLRPLAGVAGWERFTADGVTAPVTVTIEPFAVGGIRLAHRVHSAFTLRAPLARLRADETLRKSLGTTDDEADAGRPLTPEELREAGITPQRVRIGGWTGELFEHDDEGYHWREWFLAYGSIFVYAAYQCLPDNAGMDDAAIDEILETLEPKA